MGHDNIRRLGIADDCARRHVSVECTFMVVNDANHFEIGRDIHLFAVTKIAQCDSTKWLFLEISCLDQSNGNEASIDIRAVDGEVSVIANLSANFLDIGPV